MSCGTGCVYLNGEFQAPDEAKVSAFDHGFLYGDGVFETLRTYEGEPFRLAAHLERLVDGLITLSISGAPDAVEIDRLTRATLRRAELADAYLRITVTRGVGRRGLDPAHCGPPTLLIAALPLRTYPPAHYQQGIAATLLWARTHDDRPPPGVKSTSFQRAVLARLELARREAAEGFYVDRAGCVTEGTVSNVFASSGRALLTPSRDVCLPGITRAEVMQLAAKAGLDVIEAPLDRETLRHADEVFVTSSLAELLPVVRIDGVTVGAGVPGPVWRDLHGRYRQEATAA